MIIIFFLFSLIFQIHIEKKNRNEMFILSTRACFGTYSSTPQCGVRVIEYRVTGDRDSIPIWKANLVWNPLALLLNSVFLVLSPLLVRLVFVLAIILKCLFFLVWENSRYNRNKFNWKDHV